MTGNNEIMLFEEVMEYLNVGKNTLYGLLKSREIHAFKIGKVWKIPRKSVDEYINQALTDNGRTYKNKMET